MVDMTFTNDLFHTNVKHFEGNMSESENLFQSKQFKCSVSSVLNKDVKQHGKTYMFDDQEDTAWYSDQGLPQNINITFNEAIEKLDPTTCRLVVKFQGGFVGSVLHLKLDNATGQNVYLKSFYPDDINDTQIFTLGDGTEPLVNIKKISIAFEKSSDFFGRIIIYHLAMQT